MLGRQEYQPKLFTIVDIEALIPENHFLRKVDKVLDLSFVRELSADFYCPNNGRPSIDPELFFRLVLISYFYRIDSDRQVCEEVQYNLAYRWFCRLALEDAVPDHSSMTRIRDRLGEETFKKVFEKIVELCKEKELVKSKSVMTDGTLIKANASLNSMVHKEGEETENSGEGPKPPLGPPLNRKLSNETHVSKTDPDSTLAMKEGTPRTLKYKVHDTIDSESRVILDTHVTTEAVHESQVYRDRLEHIEKTFGIEIEETIADRAYGTGEILSDLKGEGVKTNIPLFSGNSGSATTPEGFEYQKKGDHFRCPEGKFLKPFAAAIKGIKIYHPNAKDCRDCERKKACTTLIGPNRRVRRNIHADLYAEVAAEMETNVFRQKLTERMWKMEGIMAEAKLLHGLEKARYRRRWKVQIQAYLTASAQNIKRLVTAVGGNLQTFLEKIFGWEFRQKNFRQELAA